MKNTVLSISALALLTACGGGQGEIIDGDPSDAPVQEADGATYGENLGDELITMDKLAYDSLDNTLVINNLPFDGVNGKYVFVGTLDDGGGASLFRRYENETGEIPYYAVFYESAYTQAGAVATDKYVGTGYGGITAQRLNASTTLPTTGEYVYLGDYAGLRTYKFGELNYVTADAYVIVDIKDFDVTGAVYGVLNNYYEYDDTGANPVALDEYTTLEPAEIDFDGERVGIAQAFLIAGDTIVQVEDQTSKVGVTGSWTGIFAGPNAQEFTGTVLVNDADLFRELGVFTTVKQ